MIIPAEQRDDGDVTEIARDSRGPTIVGDSEHAVKLFYRVRHICIANNPKIMIARHKHETVEAAGKSFQAPGQTRARGRDVTGKDQHVVRKVRQGKLTDP